MPEDLIDGKSTLVQVMALFHQAARHYLSQCSGLVPSGNKPLPKPVLTKISTAITRPQWVKHASTLYLSYFSTLSLIDFWNGIGTIPILTCLASSRFLSVSYLIALFSTKTVITNYQVLQRVYPKSYAHCLYFFSFKFCLGLVAENHYSDIIWALQYHTLCLSHIQPRAPYNFSHPYHFLPIRPNEVSFGILCQCRSLGHIRLRTPYGFDTAVHLWFDWIICRTPCRCGHRVCPAQESSMFFIYYGTRTGPMRDPQGCRTAPLQTRKGSNTTRNGKNPARASYSAVQSWHGLFTGCLRYLNPQGAHKPIIHAFELYRPRTGRQNLYAGAWGPR